MFRPIAMYWADGYKVGHRLMLFPGTSRLYGTMIPRSLKRAHKSINKVLAFGYQLTARWLHDEWNDMFFKQPIEVAQQFGKDMSMYLMVSYKADHWEALHKLGYLPIRIKALPEGVETPANIPHMTFINTVDGFAWLTLYIETIISALAWKGATSATIALQYRRNLTKWLHKTNPENMWLVDYLAHDFSARGLDPFTMVASGLGHAASFRGSDTLPVIPAARHYYDEPMNEVCINSVNASEHSVSTTWIATLGEVEMLRKWMEVFPTGFLSVVMDTMDLTRVVKPTADGYLQMLKEEIMARDGRLVIRPDSAPPGLSPVDMICGHDGSLSDRELEANYPEFYHKGLIQCLWEIFGGTEVKGSDGKMYKVLDSHIGAIYGDSITLDIQEEMYERLAAKGFAISNIVLGVGSYTYQCVTRDTFGWAVKGGWFIADGVAHNIFKDPITDSGVKRSPKGMLCVKPDMTLIQECDYDQEEAGILQIIYEDGKFYNQTTLTEIRGKIAELTAIHEKESTLA